MSQPMPPQGPQNPQGPFGQPGQPGPQQSPRSPSFMERWNAYPTRTKAIVGGIAGIVVLCLVCAVCSGLFSALSKGGSTGSTIAQNTSAPSGPTSTPKPPTSTPKPRQQTTVQHFEGKSDGTKTTTTFHIKTGDTIVWKTTVKGSANLFIADLFKQGESYGNDLPYMEIADTVNTESQSDTVTVQTPDADVYLRAVSSGVSWSIDIQRLQ